MKAFSQALHLELEQQLEAIHQQLENPIQYSEQAILVLVAGLEKLKSFFKRYRFSGRLEEMDFFRNIKPTFASRLIFYNEIYNIESAKPFGTAKAIRKFYNAELEKLKVFASDNIEFYRYYRKGSSHLDAKYFVRGRHDIRLALDSFYFQADHGFSTSHDYKVARFMANDIIKEYLEAEIQKLESTEKRPANAFSTLKWTGPKTGIVELIYALHTEGVFNHGAAGLKDIVEVFAKAFDIELAQFHRTFFEISARKAEKTKFLTALGENLLRRMQDRDAN